jgi:uncharacterized protein (DUF1810 family)
MEDGARDFDLERFVTAQAPVFADALAELQRGRKTGHWMWFVFPQMRGLGQSPTALHYGMASVAEARAYLAHPVLGPRLQACCEALLALPVTAAGPTAASIFGSPDDLKLKSSMTLFEVAAASKPEARRLFGDVLARFHAGQRDARTLVMVPTSA